MIHPGGRCRWLVAASFTAAVVAAALTVLTAGPAGFAVAQDAPKPPAESAPVPPHLAAAPVVVLNRTVAVFRSSILGLSPQERAESTTLRLRTILARGGPGVVSTQAIPQGVAVQVDGALAVLVVPGDADPLQDDSVQAVAEGVARTLRQVLAEGRESRDPRAWLAGAGLAALATVVAALLLVGLVRANAALRPRLLRFAQAHTRRVSIGGAVVVRPDRTFRILRAALNVVSWAAALVVANVWLSFVLRRFPYTRAWGERLDGFLLDVARDIAVAVAGALPNLLIALLIVLFARLGLALLRRLLDRVEAGQVRLSWLDADTTRPMRRIATAVVWLFALAMAYPYLPGSGSDAFKGLSVLVGLMISIGASSSVAQGASGLILMFTRSYRPGEYVRIGDHEGTVSELGVFVTRIQTGLGEELVVPNALVLGAVTRNYSRTVSPPGFVLDTAVTIGYDAPWRQVHAMLVEAARRTPGVLPAPPPRVFQTELADFYVAYRLVCHAIASEPMPRAEVLSRLHGSIQDVFNQHGVQIMSPHYRGDPAAPKVVPPARWYEPPANRTDGAEAQRTVTP